MSESITASTLEGSFLWKWILATSLGCGVCVGMIVLGVSDPVTKIPLLSGVLISTCSLWIGLAQWSVLRLLGIGFSIRWIWVYLAAVVFFPGLFFYSRLSDGFFKI